MRKNLIIPYIITIITISIAIWFFQSLTHMMSIHEINYEKKLLAETIGISANYIKEEINYSIERLKDIKNFIMPSLYNSEKQAFELKEAEKRLQNIVKETAEIKSIILTDPFGIVLLSYPQRNLKGINLHADIGELHLFNMAEESSTKASLRVLMYKYLDKDKMKLKKKYGLLCIFPVYKKWEMLGYLYGIIDLKKIIQKTALKQTGMTRVIDDKGHTIYPAEPLPHLSSKDTITDERDIKIKNISLRIYASINKKDALIGWNKLKRITNITLIAVIVPFLILLVIIINKDRKYIEQLNKEIEKHTSEIRKANNQLLNLLLLNGELMEAETIDEIKNTISFYLGKLIEGVKSISEAVPAGNNGFILKFIEGKKPKEKISLNFKNIPSKPVYAKIDEVIKGKSLEILKSAGLNYVFVIPVTAVLKEDSRTIIFLAFTEKEIEDSQKLIPPLSMMENEAILAITRAKLFERLQKAAETDHLTGLANRRKFDEIVSIEIERAIRYKRILSISIADIDSFKEVNDTFGHRRGDSVLIGIASLLKENTRKMDTVCRYGGDEFAILFPEISKKEAEEIMLRIRKKVEDYANKNKLPISLSFGISSYPEDSTDAEKLLNIADNAMYEDKKRRNARR